MTEILYLTHNRLEFTQLTWEMLLRNTDWLMVSAVHVYDDMSVDGTHEWMSEAILSCPVPAHLHRAAFGSPVAVMAHYLREFRPDVFVKLDNDIVVPPGWLNALGSVWIRHPDLELLGFEAGRTAVPQPELAPKDYMPQYCSHIGGVGMMSGAAFLRKGRRALTANGRFFGFTEWQQLERPRRAWIEPDLACVCLDRVPFEPWRSLAHKYVEEGWARGQDGGPWGAYDARWMSGYWRWWHGEER